MKRYGLGLWLALTLCGLVSGARADEPLAVEASVRAFGGRERIPYAALTLQRKEWTLRGVAAKKSVYSRGVDARLLHGGDDLELARSVSLPKGIAGELGAAFSDTASQRKKLHATVRARWDRAVTDEVRLSVEPRAVLGGTTLAGVGLGTRVKLDAQTDFVGEFTPIVSGRNTRDWRSGAASKNALWEMGFAVKERGHPERIVTIGATNALGPTTGLSLSPSIGGSALVVKVRILK